MFLFSGFGYLFLRTNITSYKEMAEPHINQDKGVTPEEVTAMERLLNGHNYQFCRVFEVCSAWDNGRKVKGAVTNKNLPPKVLPKQFSFCYL